MSSSSLQGKISKGVNKEPMKKMLKELFTKSETFNLSDHAYVMDRALHDIQQIREVLQPNDPQLHRLSELENGFKRQLSLQHVHGKVQRFLKKLYDNGKIFNSRDSRVVFDKLKELSTEIEELGNKHGDVSVAQRSRSFRRRVDDAEKNGVLLEPIGDGSFQSIGEDDFWNLSDTDASRFVSHMDEEYRRNPSTFGQKFFTLASRYGKLQAEHIELERYKQTSVDCKKDKDQLKKKLDNIDKELREEKIKHERTLEELKRVKHDTGNLEKSNKQSDIDCKKEIKRLEDEIKELKKKNEQLLKENKDLNDKYVKKDNAVTVMNSENAARKAAESILGKGGDGPSVGDMMKKLDAKIGESPGSVRQTVFTEMHEIKNAVGEGNVTRRVQDLEKLLGKPKTNKKIVPNSMVYIPPVVIGAPMNGQFTVEQDGGETKEASTTATKSPDPIAEVQNAQMEYLRKEFRSNIAALYDQLKNNMNIEEDFLRWLPSDPQFVHNLPDILDFVVLYVSFWLDKLHGMQGGHKYITEFVDYANNIKGGANSNVLKEKREAFIEIVKPWVPAFANETIPPRIAMYEKGLRDIELGDRPRLAFEKRLHELRLFVKHLEESQLKTMDAYTGFKERLEALVQTANPQSAHDYSALYDETNRYLDALFSDSVFPTLLKQITTYMKQAMDAELWQLKAHGTLTEDDTNRWDAFDIAYKTMHPVDGLSDRERLYNAALQVFAFYDYFMGKKGNLLQQATSLKQELDATVERLQYALLYFDAHTVHDGMTHALRVVASRLQDYKNTNIEPRPLIARIAFLKETQRAINEVLHSLYTLIRDDSGAHEVFYNLILKLRDEAAVNYKQGLQIRSGFGISSAFLLTWVLQFHMFEYFARIVERGDFTRLDLNSPNTDITPGDLFKETFMGVFAVHHFFKFWAPNEYQNVLDTDVLRAIEKRKKKSFGMVSAATSVALTEGSGKKKGKSGGVKSKKSKKGASTLTLTKGGVKEKSTDDHPLNNFLDDERTVFGMLETVLEKLGAYGDGPQLMDIARMVHRIMTGIVTLELDHTNESDPIFYRVHQYRFPSLYRPGRDDAVVPGRRYADDIYKRLDDLTLAYHGLLDPIFKNVEDRAEGLPRDGNEFLHILRDKDQPDETGDIVDLNRIPRMLKTLFECLRHYKERDPEHYWEKFGGLFSNDETKGDMTIEGKAGPKKDPIKHILEPFGMFYRYKQMIAGNTMNAESLGEIIRMLIDAANMHADAHKEMQSKWLSAAAKAAEYDAIKDNAIQKLLGDRLDAMKKAQNEAIDGVHDVLGATKKGMDDVKDKLGQAQDAMIRQQKELAASDARREADAAKKHADAETNLNNVLDGIRVAIGFNTNRVVDVYNHWIGNIKKILPVLTGKSSPNSADFTLMMGHRSFPKRMLDLNKLNQTFQFLTNPARDGIYDPVIFHCNECNDPVVIVKDHLKNKDPRVLVMYLCQFHKARLAEERLPPLMSMEFISQEEVMALYVPTV